MTVAVLTVAAALVAVTARLGKAATRVARAVLAGSRLAGKASLGVACETAGHSIQRPAIFIHNTGEL